VARYLNTYPDHTVIIAPHETTADHIDSIEHQLQSYGLDTCRLTDLKHGLSESCQVMIIDRVGLLANVYALGALVYVGGSRGPGIHNILEPAAHQSAVIFGPRYHNSVEAVEMVDQQCATVVHTADQVFSQLDELGRGDPRVNEMGTRARTMVDRYLGATDCTIKAIETVLPDNA
jgi:3-deoxy-D-manno-octulosonic-acid transferase